MKVISKKRIYKIMLILTVVIVIVIVVYFANYYNLLPKKSYTADDFNISTLRSNMDFNNNGIDDYTDILIGAQNDAKNHPKYDGSYHDGGYPPDNIGVCTDVVWRAFKNAGYNLREMIDNDIIARPDKYPNIKTRDINIDFRRVMNLRIFFEEYAVSVTNDINQIEKWQPGDIVIFGNNKHIGIVSNKRNKNGHPYIIHNAGQPIREEDYLKRRKVTGHYRFDATKIKQSVLVAWTQ